jgi:hypothetical protein
MLPLVGSVEDVAGASTSGHLDADFLATDISMVALRGLIAALVLLLASSTVVAEA